LAAICVLTGAGIFTIFGIGRASNDNYNTLQEMYGAGIRLVKQIVTNRVAAPQARQPFSRHELMQSAVRL